MNDKHGHGMLPPPFGPPGPPFLPNEGDIYWVVSLLYRSYDPAPCRPVVVLEVPRLISGRIKLVTRTTDLRAAGIRHPACLALGLDREGVFTDLVSVERSLWCPQCVRRRGELDKPTWYKVQERFG